MDATANYLSYPYLSDVDASEIQNSSFCLFEKHP